MIAALHGATYVLQCTTTSRSPRSQASARPGRCHHTSRQIRRAEVHRPSWPWPAGRLSQGAPGVWWTCSSPSSSTATGERLQQPAPAPEIWRGARYRLYDLLACKRTPAGVAARHMISLRRDPSNPIAPTHPEPRRTGRRRRPGRPAPAPRLPRYRSPQIKKEVPALSSLYF